MAAIAEMADFTSEKFGEVVNELIACIIGVKPGLGFIDLFLATSEATSRGASSKEYSTKDDKELHIETCKIAGFEIEAVACSSSVASRSIWEYRSDGEE